jgi:alpha-tubulin suppressor-like RCC1 family protein
MYYFFSFFFPKYHAYSRRGDFGRLGHGNSSDVFTPQPVKALQGIKIKQIACGDSHCLAVTIDGEVQRLSIIFMLEKLINLIVCCYLHKV